MCQGDFKGFRKFMKKSVLGVSIDDITEEQALSKVKSWLAKLGKHYIVTPNPEIVIIAQKDTELKKIINSADLAIPDGVGLRLSTDIVCNIPGIDFMEALIKYAADYGFTTGFLGGRGDVAKKTVECLRKKYPKLKVSLAKSGGEIDSDGRSSEVLSIPQTDLLFVAFGPPKQEKWVSNNLVKQSVKVMMVVGGAFDILSGRIPRAPIFLRKLSLEWLFRLIIQPWRIKRQLALLKFIYLSAKK